MARADANDGHTGGVSFDFGFVAGVGITLISHFRFQISDFAFQIEESAPLGADGTPDGAIVA
jgi:hypothetical protein